MTLAELNALYKTESEAVLLRCCGSTRWAREMTQRRPFSNVAAIVTEAADVWLKLTYDDWREAFSHHPRIGDVKSLREIVPETTSWAREEQAGVDNASDEVLKQVADANHLYEQRFGYIFIVCASGKSVEEMLNLLRQRLKNTPADEIRIASNEQSKIMRLRLEKMLMDR
jgi:2-oxo-4-hydroxy-4-carboxy-5-ureidoimidazoline decarboxylase